MCACAWAGVTLCGCSLAERPVGIGVKGMEIVLQSESPPLSSHHQGSFSFLSNPALSPQPVLSPWRQILHLARSLPRAL